MRNAYKGCGSCILFVVTTYLVYTISFPIFMEQLDPEGSTKSDNRLTHKAARTYGGRHIICHHFHGGIGDQLFQYASILAIAQNTERLIVSKDGDSILENFIVDLQARPGASQCDGVVKIVEKFCCRDDDRFINIDRNKNYDFQGFLQSWTYFKDSEYVMSNYIQFQTPVIEKAHKTVHNVLHTRGLSMLNNVLVGVHVKRGNRLMLEHVQHGYRVAPREYFLKAMDYFRKRNNKKSPLFLVVSQDVDWCRENILGPSDVFFIPPQEPETDMAIFTQVDHAVISVGSFTWWAGHFTRGEVIYYKQPIEPDSKIMTEYGGTLAKTFKPSWVGQG